jgi:hypothetical protein
LNIHVPISAALVQERAWYGIAAENERLPKYPDVAGTRGLAFYFLDRDRDRDREQIDGDVAALWHGACFARFLSQAISFDRQPACAHHDLKAGQILERAAVLSWRYLVG